MSIEDIKLKDIQILLDVIRLGSLREASRTRQCQPSQISRTINQLENHFGQRLIERSLQGVTPTAFGNELLPSLKKIHDMSESLQHPTREHSERITIAAAAFIASYIVPLTLQPNSKSQYRLLELNPTQILPVGLRNGFSAAVHLNKVNWPTTWTSKYVGDVEFALVCRHGHPIKPKASSQEFIKYPFVYPVYWENNELRYGNDNFPMKISKRIRGAETSTVTSALEVIMHTNQLAFIPRLSVTQMLKKKVLKEIITPRKYHFKQALYLSVKSDRVKQTWFLDMQKKLKDVLKQK